MNAWGSITFLCRRSKGRKGTREPKVTELCREPLAEKHALGSDAFVDDFILMDEPNSIGNVDANLHPLQP